MSNHHELVEQAKKFVAESSLSENEKELLVGRLPYVSTVVLDMFVAVCVDDPFSINLLVKNLKLKLDAQGNLTKINAVKQQEREYYQSVIAMA
jgi:hypothetical protein